MADSAVVVTAGTGTNIDTRTEDTNGHHRQVVVIGDPTANAGVAPVDATAGLKVNLGADNDITGTVTANLSAVDNAVLDSIDAAVNGTLTVGTHDVTNAGTFATQVTSLPSSTNTIEVVGDAAENAAVSGNPVLTGGRYDSTPRTLGDGDVGAIALDADGAVQISDGGNSITVDGSLTVDLGANNDVTVTSGTVTANLGAVDNAVLDDIAANQTDASQKTQIVDGSGNVIGSTGNALDVNIASGSSAGTQYDDGDADATPTGTVAMGTDGSNVFALTSDTDGHLQVDVLSAPTTTVTGTVTANLSSTDNTVLDNIEAGIDELKTGIVLSSGTNGIGKLTANSGVDIGDVDVTSLPSDTFVADGGALGKGVLIQGDDGTDRNNITVDTDGHLQVDVLTGGGGGTQYDEGDTDTTITGTAIMWEDTSDTLRSVSAAKPLPVDLGTNNDVTVTNATAANLKVDGSDVTQPVSNAGLTELAAAINSNKVDVNIVSSDVATGGTSAIDDADFTAESTSGTPSMGVYESSPTSVTDGDLGVIGITQTRALKVQAQANSGVDIGDVTINNATIAVTQSGTWDEVGINDSGNSITVDQSAHDNFNANANVQQGNTDVGSGNPLEVTLANGSVPSHAVTNAGTFAVQVDGSALTALQLIDDTVHADDATFTLGTSKGVMMMGFAGTQSVDANDAGAVAMDTDGAIHISDGGNTITVDGTVTANLSAVDNAVLDTIETNTDFGTVVGGGTETGALRVTIANNSTGVVSVDDNGSTLTVDGTVAVSSISTSVTPGTAASNLGKAEDAAHATGHVGVMALAVRDDTAPAAHSGTDGDYEPFHTDANGSLWVSLGTKLDQTNDAVSIYGSDDGGTTKRIIETDSGGAVAIQDGGNSITVDNAGLTELAAAIDTEVQVDVVGALPSGTNTIGGVFPVVSTSGTGTSTFYDPDLDETKIEVTDNATVMIYSIQAFNTTDAPLFLQLFDLDADSVTVGTTAPTNQYVIPGNANSDGAGFVITFSVPKAYTTGFTVACTTDSQGSAAPGAGACIVNIEYKA